MAVDADHARCRNGCTDGFKHAAVAAAEIEDAQAAAGVERLHDGGKRGFRGRHERRQAELAQLEEKHEYGESREQRENDEDDGVHTGAFYRASPIDKTGHLR